MNEKQQITYMQARIIRLASEKWNVPVKEIGSIFTEFRVFVLFGTALNSFM